MRTITFYAKWGLGTILGAIGPWIQAFFQLGLISDYFQPSLNGAASASGALAFLISYGFLRDAAPPVLKGRLKLWSALTTALLVVLLALKFSVGVLLVPDTAGAIMLWIAWFIVYLAFFIFLSMLLAAAALLAG